jgi:hypothetical protein
MCYLKYIFKLDSLPILPIATNYPSASVLLSCWLLLPSVLGVPPQFMVLLFLGLGALVPRSWCYGSSSVLLFLLRPRRSSFLAGCCFPQSWGFLLSPWCSCSSALVLLFLGLAGAPVSHRRCSCSSAALVLI